MKNYKIFIFVASFVCLISLNAWAESSEKDFSADMKERQASGGVRMTRAIGASFSNEAALSLIGRVGVDINQVLELGVEGHGSIYGAVGGGAYAKVPLKNVADDGRYYVIAATGATKWMNRDSNFDTLSGSSIGIGREFKSGTFIEGRVGKLKKQFKNPCVHYDYGCVDGGTENSTMFNLTVGAAF